MTLGQTIRSEEQIIQEFLAPLSRALPGAFGLTDDCGVLTPEPGTELVFKTDPVIAGVHFFADDPAEDIAWKALAVNISDLAAKGATPLAYLMALAFPTAPTRTFMTQFAAGLAQAQATFGCHLLGGDTDRTPGPLTLSITAIGSVPSGQMVRRGTARAGDLIYVTGSIGDAHLGLRLRRERGAALFSGLAQRDAEILVNRYLRPEPRLGLASALRAHAGAAMDVSDGLLKDVGRMCRTSGVGAQIEAGRVPMSPAAARVLARAPDLLADLMTGGDDYEVLAAVPPSASVAFEAAAAAAAVAVTRIGWFVPDGGVSVLDRHGVPMSFARQGHDHFQQ